MKSLTPSQYAYNAGRDYAQQIVADFANHQNGPGLMTGDLPEADYIDLRTRFGAEALQFLERDYRQGYNSVEDDMWPDASAVSDAEYPAERGAI
jgi:hypothetical protein